MKYLLTLSFESFQAVNICRPQAWYRANFSAGTPCMKAKTKKRRRTWIKIQSCSLVYNYKVVCIEESEEQFNFWYSPDDLDKLVLACFTE